MYDNVCICRMSYMACMTAASLCTSSAIINRSDHISIIAAVLLKPVLRTPHHCTFWMSPSSVTPNSSLAVSTRAVELNQVCQMRETSKMCSSEGPQDTLEKHCHSSVIVITMLNYSECFHDRNMYKQYLVNNNMFSFCKNRADSLAIYCLIKSITFLLQTDKGGPSSIYTRFHPSS